MPTDAEQKRDALGRLAMEGAAAPRVAEALVETLAGLQRVLTPIVGARGVAALYQRALHLAGQAHPTLGALSAGAIATMDLDALRTALAALGGPEAAAAGDELIQHFRAVLTSLIGTALAGHLLDPILDPTRGDAVQDT